MSRRIWPLVLLAGCGHPDPSMPAEPADVGPVGSLVPRQLTFNLGTDRGPSWSDDGRALVYSYEDVGRMVPDRCIGVLPAAGGTREVSACRDLATFNDSLDAFEWPAARGGRVAYMDATSTRLDDAPEHRYLTVAPLDRPYPGQRVLTFPYISGTGRSHDLALSLGWLDADRLVYIGATAFVAKPCQFCRSDTLYLGQDLMVLDLGSQAPTRSEVPGTFLVNSAAPGPDGHSVVYTVAGDSRVFQRDLNTGQVSVLIDFGLGQFVRDVQLVGRRLVVILGGKITLTSDPLLGLVARDEGGNLIAVDLETGARTDFTQSARFYRRPALAPSGRGIVAEAYPYAIQVIRDPFGNPVALDTVVTRSADLWLMEEE